VTSAVTVTAGLRPAITVTSAANRKLINTLIATAMPQVAAMVKAKREQWGDAHVTRCIQQGLAGVPGWFFAREGAVMVGTPWGDWLALQADTPLLSQTQVWMPDPQQAAELMQ
jgi:hypothetical protein